MPRYTPGFTLIELVIALTIASILSLMVFAFVRQSTQINARVLARMDYSLALTVAYNQVERDLMAIMVPESAYATYKRSLKKNRQEKSSEQATSEKEEKRKRDLPPPFFARSRDNRLELLFFTSTNRLTRHKVFAPYNNRIVYQLVPDISSPGLFNLVRAESDNLARPIEDFTKGEVHSHILLSRIKSLAIKLFVPEEQKAEPKQESKSDGVGKQGGAKPAEPKKIVYKELSEWDPAALKQANYMVPAYIEISGERADPDGKTFRPFMISCKVPVFEWQYGRIKKMVESLDKKPKKEQDKKTNLTVGAKTKPSLAKPSLTKPSLAKPSVGRPAGPAGKTAVKGR